jgi:hypothetical protein
VSRAYGAELAASARRPTAPNDPKPRDDHMREHKENGDFKRWGARSLRARTLARGLAVGSALGAVPGVMDLSEALREHPDLPFSAQFGMLGGTIDKAGLYRVGERDYIYLPPEWIPSSDGT